MDVGCDPDLPRTTMQTLLESERLNVDSEQAVFTTLATWMKRLANPLDEEERRNLFALVRFPLLSEGFVESTVMSESMFVNTWLSDYEGLFFGIDRQTRLHLNLRRERMNFSNILSFEDHRQILVWLRKTRKDPPIVLERVYCASIDGFSSRNFHLRYTHLLTVICGFIF